ncbi:MAG TPA: epoxyqueuosine reductase QueH [Pseudothermotoga sp.]
MQILLHVCCAPDATTAVERLHEEGYEPILFFFNPNIQPEEEYEKRLEATVKLANLWNLNLIVEKQDKILWEQQIKGLEDLPEGSFRCVKCIEYRLRSTAEYAKKNGFHIFSTTLTTSPKKNSKLILQIGETIAEELKIEYLHKDFKKKNGFLRSVELSKKLGLYRQNYCGCIYSLRKTSNGG